MEEAQANFAEVEHALLKAEHWNEYILDVIRNPNIQLTPIIL